MQAGGELLVWLWLAAQNVHPIVPILVEAGRAWIGQQDELCEAMKVRHTAESLQHEDHGDQAQEEVDCRDGRGAMGGLRPPGHGRGATGPPKIGQ